ncbi:putative disease resistance RPP13-like protein 3 [Triticum dicoccoides]|uniref:putative disease resistance RPP13-like protein 3 n=1 Tax=Triticum dicoccoides TaxID=85692 RepID=UPI001890F647|nr:putative disease resistance RPP13-like protein 3 [Triticum dicoccoides]
MAFASSTTAIAAWRDDLENAVGFDKDLEILQRTMLPSRNRSNLPQHPMFISIVGESGAGKNTLAKIIRHEMKPEMDVIVWCDMEPGSSTADLLIELYQRASLQCNCPAPDDSCSRIEQEVTALDIGENLRNLLTGKRYMLILGGISSKTILNSVRASLPEQDQDESADNGSRVVLILDTENEEVAFHANTMNRKRINGIHLLTRLDQTRSGELFFWKVLRKGQQPESSLSSRRRSEQRQSFFWELFWRRGQYEKESRIIADPKDEEYSRLVHDLTGGYPMAIVLLAGLLRVKEKPVEWDAVLQQLISGSAETKAIRVKGNNRQASQPLRTGKAKGINRQANQRRSTRRAMEMIFWASFEDLPDDLKSCFLYLASYPKGSSHPAHNIVRMWIAEGFIKQPGDGKTMEELGHDYLKELVLRCLVELERMKPGGGIELVRVHKSIMRLLQSEVREAGFMGIHDINDAQVPPSVRRLSVQSGNGRRYTSTFANKKFPKLRSFICHIVIDQQQHQHDLMFLCSSKFIRVISVQGLRLDKLPDKIGDMINLRYLRVDCRKLSSLPSSIARLHYLQTFDIRNTQVEQIDQNFWKIKTLRHVLATKLTLPATMSVVEQDQNGGGGSGSELQTLHGVKPDASGEWSAGNCPLDKMTSLQSMEMHGFTHSRHAGPAFEAALGNMNLLGHLNLKGDKIPSCVFTDPSLRSLQTMVLHGDIDWAGITAGHLRTVRPNLVQLKLRNIHDEVPQRISNHLGKKLIMELVPNQGTPPARGLSCSASGPVRRMCT